MVRWNAATAISFVVVTSIGFSVSRAAWGADPADVPPPAPPATQADAPPVNDAVPPSNSRLQQIPGLGNLIQPDGSIILPGGAGIIRRDPNHVGVQINTPDGPFEFVVPRRRRAQRNADLPAAPGSDTDAPAFGSPSAPGGRPADRDRIAPRSRSGQEPSAAENAQDRAQERRALHEYAVAARLFHARNYLAALRRTDRGLERDPGDQNLLQLRSLIFFTQGDYRAAYRDARTALADDDVWDWATVRSLYHPGEYTARYRMLEETVSANPNAPELWFLLAYHNRMLGNRGVSKEQFQRVAVLDPANETARRLSLGQLSTPTVVIPPMPSAADRQQPSIPTPAPSRRQAPSRVQSGGSISVDLGKPAPTNSANGPELVPPNPAPAK